MGRAGYILWPGLVSGLTSACGELDLSASALMSPHSDTESRADTADSVEEFVTEGWQRGEPEVCEAPVPTRWSDRSDLTWDGKYYSAQAWADTACVALEQRGSEWFAWASGFSPLTEEGQARPEIDLHRVNLGTGERSVLAVPHLHQRLFVDDFDGDGLDDVGAFLDTGVIVWGGTDVAVPLPASQASFAYAPFDLQGDGLTDLLVAGAGESGQDSPPPPMWLTNQGGRQFGAAVPALDDGIGLTFSGTVLDWDEDGDPDLYSCNDSGILHGPNRAVLLDDDGLAIGEARGADVVAGCMSTSFGDVDLDGRLDLYTAEAALHRLLINYGEDGFVDVAAARVASWYGSEQMGWSSTIVDGDNDGLPDLFESTGAFARGTNPGWPVWWLRQDADGGFADEGAAAGLPQDAAPRGMVLRDVNGDGVVDMLVADIRRAPYLLLSEGCSEGAWVEVSAPNGSRVTVEADGRTWTALATRQDGWCGWGPAVAHIGLGNATVVDRIIVRAPWQPAAATYDVPVRTRLRWTPPAP